MLQLLKRLERAAHVKELNIGEVFHSNTKPSYHQRPIPKWSPEKLVKEIGNNGLVRRESYHHHESPKHLTYITHYMK
jgi:hypothetical protein